MLGLDSERASGTPYGHYQKLATNGKDTETIAVHDKDDCFPPNAAASGGIYATVDDWLKFLDYAKRQLEVSHPSSVADCSMLGAGAQYTTAVWYPDGYDHRWQHYV